MRAKLHRGQMLRSKGLVPDASSECNCIALRPLATIRLESVGAKMSEREALHSSATDSTAHPTYAGEGE